MKPVDSIKQLNATRVSHLKKVEHDGKSRASTPKTAWKSPRDSWAGRGRIVGDIVEADTSQL